MLIELSYRKVLIYTADGVDMLVRQAIVRDQRESPYLADIERHACLERIEFLVKWGIFTKKIPISLKLERAIASHLRVSQAQGDMSFDCYAFANLIENQPRHTVRYMEEHWDIRKLGNHPERGSIVFLLTRAESEFHHAACYLGMGLYISIWGAGGDLEIATRGDMMRGYKTNEVFLATPKQRKLDPA